jgi:BirA family biotin operon repressor/biotin-[acetyl-CoA-carboxylase] ligase
MTQNRVDPERRHIGRKVREYRSLESTNALAATLGLDPAHHGLVILAGEQTSGRGQYGRCWLAPAGSSVLMSVLLFPPEPLRRPALLTAWAAVAVAEVILRMTGKQARIKWPNDVLLHGKKVCGILVEQGRATVAGIGLNVQQTAEYFEQAQLPLAGSLTSATGQIFETEEIANQLIRQLDEEYDQLLNGEIANLESRWKWRIGLLGHQVLAIAADGACISGRLRDMTFTRIELEQPNGLRELHPELIRQLLPADTGRDEVGANNS